MSDTLFVNTRQQHARRSQQCVHTHEEGFSCQRCLLHTCLQHSNSLCCCVSRHYWSIESLSFRCTSRRQHDAESGGAWARLPSGKEQDNSASAFSKLISKFKLRYSFFFFFCLIRRGLNSLSERVMFAAVSIVRFVTGPGEKV